MFLPLAETDHFASVMLGEWLPGDTLPVLSPGPAYARRNTWPVERQASQQLADDTDGLEQWFAELQSTPAAFEADVQCLAGPTTLLHSSAARDSGPQLPDPLPSAASSGLPLLSPQRYGLETTKLAHGATYVRDAGALDGLLLSPQAADRAAPTQKHPPASAGPGPRRGTATAWGSVIVPDADLSRAQAVGNAAAKQSPQPSVSPGREPEGSDGGAEAPLPSAAARAVREKARRQRLNDMFTELSTLLDPSQSKRTDKHSIVAEAIRAVTDLRSEAQRLRSLVGSLEDRLQAAQSAACASNAAAAPQSLLESKPCCGTARCPSQTGGSCSCGSSALPQRTSQDAGPAGGASCCSNRSSLSLPPPQPEPEAWLRTAIWANDGSAPEDSLLTVPDGAALHSTVTAGCPGGQSGAVIMGAKPMADPAATADPPMSISPQVATAGGYQPSGKRGSAALTACERNCSYLCCSTCTCGAGPAGEGGSGCGSIAVC